MIELPGAALNADKIARYADFFSFGTNDLTQTTNGISRDDFNSFFTDYNEYDLLERNPFKYLNGPVKELVQIATERGRMVRPDMKMGLCGEHGAEPENVDFCMDTGLNYVSCSPYGILHLFRGLEISDLCISVDSNFE
jgi:pyruvate,orthophosphate dikinase